MARTKVIEGVSLANGVPPETTNPIVKVPGSCAGRPSEFQLGWDDLCRQVGVLGGTGSGKTNALRPIVRCMHESLGGRGGLLVFDPKGDYREICDGRESSALLGEAECSVGFNVFRDVMHAGRSGFGKYAAVVARALFAGCKRDGGTQDFFVDAAELLVAEVIEAMALHAGMEPGFERNLTNAGFCDFLCNGSVKNLRDFCEGVVGVRSTAGKLLGDGGTGQALGILAEVVRQVGRVRGLLCEDTTIGDSVGVCDLLDRGVTVRLQHDVSSASVSPMLLAIIELYMKGVMDADRRSPDSIHCVVLEEMGTLPRIAQLPSALTYGRSRGLSLICCTQSVSQIASAYGDDEAASILGGFQTLLAFGTNDAGTRKELACRYGDNVVLRSHVGASGMIECETARQPVIADWHVSSLSVGEAIVCPTLPRHPYRFMFERSE